MQNWGAREGIFIMLVLGWGEKQFTCVCVCVCFIFKCNLTCAYNQIQIGSRGKFGHQNGNSICADAIHS